MVDEVTLAISIAAIVISIAGTIPLYLDYFARREEKRAEILKEQEEKLKEEEVRFEIERFREKVDSINYVWNVRILHPNKPIEHCMVIAHPSISSGYSLPIALLIPDKPEHVHDTKIPIGGGANFRFPKSIISPGLMMIVVRDNDKVLLTRSFGDIPETTP